jgi:hypothetical protein
MIWKSFIMSFGDKYILWSNLPENPNHNWHLKLLHQ